MVLHYKLPKITQRTAEEAQLTYLKIELHMLAAESNVNYRGGACELLWWRLSRGGCGYAGEPEFMVALPGVHARTSSSYFA
jgi:hypothetical protein